MVSARKMFEDIGYRIPVVQDEERIFYYTGNIFNREEIAFLLKDKEVRIDAKHVRPELLRAIYKQCEELGWYE